MIQPTELGSERPHGPWSCRGRDVWEAIGAAAAGDAVTLRRLLERDSNLYRAEYWYTQPIHFAVREGHIDAVRVLLDAGADPAAMGCGGDDLITIARDRNHEAVARLLEEVGAERGGIAPARTTRGEHAIHVAAAAGDAVHVRRLLDAEPQLVHSRDGQGGTPLHRAVAASARDVIGLLLERGADIHALHGSGPGTTAGYAAADFLPIDMAFWTGPFWGIRGDIETARLLIDRGAACDVVIAAALGDLERVDALLDEDPGRIREARPCGKRALSSAVESGHEQVARLLLNRGADPNWPEGSTAPRGVALHAAARAGSHAMVTLLLAHGADPNGAIDSSGSATYAAQTRELRALLLAHGGRLDAYDLVWMDEDDEVVRLVCSDLPDMIELLLARGAPTSLLDDEPWATPLAWATRRGHVRIAGLLQRAGAEK